MKIFSNQIDAEEKIIDFIDEKIYDLDGNIHILKKKKKIILYGNFRILKEYKIGEKYEYISKNTFIYEIVIVSLEFGNLSKIEMEVIG